MPTIKTDFGVISLQNNVAGVSPSIISRKARMREWPQSRPGYVRVIIGHDGSNPVLGKRFGYCLEIGRSTRLPQRHVVTPHTCGAVVMLFPDIEIKKMALEINEDETGLILWHLTHFHDPGRGGFCLGWPVVKLCSSLPPDRPRLLC